jgi:Ser/Thr protein kinase RdoA (MazF antagonist)
VRDNRPMERGWERAHPFVGLPAGELERLVAAGLPGARVVSASPLASGLRNTNYRVELDGGRSVVLRLYVAYPAACEREAAVLAAVAGRVPAPKVLHSAPIATPPFALLEWLDGRPLDAVLPEADAAASLELAAACGSALASIHRIRFPEAGFLGPGMRITGAMPAWAPTVLATLAGPVEHRLGPGLSARVRSTVESNAHAVEPIWSEAVLVHADYRPPNLLVERDTAPRPQADRPGRWRLAGILDWEFACAGCRLIDFATFLRDEGSRPPGFGDAFARAYVDAGGSLPDDWPRLTGLVDLLNLLQLLAWADDRAAVELRRLVAASIAYL